jgi:hypothetical protein
MNKTEKEANVREATNSVQAAKTELDSVYLRYMEGAITAIELQTHVITFLSYVHNANLIDAFQEDGEDTTERKM